MNGDNKTEKASSDKNSTAAVPIKMNGEIKKISIEEASELAQKGLKFEMIRKNYERLASVAKKQNASVSEIIEKIEQDSEKTRRDKLLEMCSGNEEFADHILKLEGETVDENRGFDELHVYFPQFSKPEQLPVQVIEAVRLNNTRLLDEYLRFKLREKIARIKNERNRAEADSSSIGSQRRSAALQDSVNTEFLRGLWNI